MLELDDREVSRRSRTRGIVARYALTAAEEKVLNGLVRGRTPEEAAAELGITMNTIRTHVRHILQKTGSRRIADLLNLI
jgi:DNA-binding CsgD family transcriptional regulator